MYLVFPKPGIRAVGISAGAGSNNLSAVTFSNDNNVSFGLNGAVITATAGPDATFRFFERRELITNDSSAIAPGIGSIYVHGFTAPLPLDSGRINVLLSFSDSSLGIFKGTTAGSIYASNTSGSRQITYSFSSALGVYKLDVGTNSTRLTQVWSNTWSMGISHTVSVSTSNVSQLSINISAQIAFPGTVNTLGSYTFTTYGATHQQATAASSVCTSVFTTALSSLQNIMSGRMQIPVGFNTSLSPGNYWMAMRWSTASTTAGSSIDVIWPIVNQVAIPGNTAVQSYRMLGSTAATAGSYVMPGNGTYTNATTAAFPATIAFTDIRSLASHYSWYWNYMQSNASST